MITRLNTEEGKPARYCSNCRRRIPLSNTNGLCKECLKTILFKDVKKYIQENDVNEIEVAEHFGIDREIIREWINEGHLEYKYPYNSQGSV